MTELPRGLYETLVTELLAGERARLEDLGPASVRRGGSVVDCELCLGSVGSVVYFHLANNFHRSRLASAGTPERAMPVDKLEVDGLEGLLSGVLKIAGSLREGGFLWYRGLPCSKFELLPKLLREGKTSDEVFERERRLLTRFRQRSMAYWPAGYPQNDWEHLFAMQHHGMPTRLLDWSENLFVAAHFALTTVPSHKHEGPCIPCVWCVDPVAWNRSTPVLSEFGEAVQVLTTADEDLDAYRPDTPKKRRKSPIAMFGAHNSARIVAQRGTFMIWGNDNLPLESIAQQQAHSSLHRIDIAGDWETLGDSLRMIGFGETMVFPELPSLGTELSRSENWR